MTLGSLFDGIGGWPLAAIHADVEPVWCSEIEPFPQTVTKRHFPKMEQLGDIIKIDGTQIAPVDIVTIGSPCQDLSIAGKRKGLDGERSGLFRTAIDIVRAMRRATGKTYPRFVVWENVPGAFSSNKGNDFRAVLEEITESQLPMPESGRWAKAGMVRSNGCEVAWRTLDAQYWGVPQRRKRIFLVADFRGGCAAEILFKPEGMRRNTAAGGSKREKIAGSVADSTRAAVVELRRGYEDGRKGALASIEKSLTLSANPHDQSGCHPAVQRPILASGEKVTGCLMASAATKQWLGNQEAFSGNYSVLQPTAYGFYPQRKAEGISWEKERATCLVNGTNPGWQNGVLPFVAGSKSTFAYKARRLTPTECERLQGLPDGYTVGGSDSARYKALGNGMAQPCADFVIRRIAEVAQL